jgi:arabinofuranan 3-O-arabinosyltransferase
MGLGSAALVIMCLLQAPGRIVSDTKVDIAVAPLTFLSHALNLWSPQQEFGGVPFQAYGYLMPMGPFFVLGHAIGLPIWIVQRLWVATLLIAAFWGVVRLAEAIGIGSRTSRLVAGFAFALAPPISLLGGKTAFVLPFALLPWVLIPLIDGAKGGSPRIAACRSGVALFLMGGVNAAASVAVLPLPVLWFLTREPGPRRRQLAKWWGLAIVLACTWWATSLYLESRYGFNLLPFTETSTTTTSTTSLFDVLRGNTYWVAYDQIGSTAIRSGLEATTYPAMIVAGAVMGALGLFGLAHQRLKERRWLVVSLAVGVVLIGSGYPGVLGAPGSPMVQEILSGPLALFRNVWKFQPTLNLVLALGIAHALAMLTKPITELGRSVRWRQWRTLGRVAVVVVASISLIGMAIPFLTDAFFTSGSFRSIPTYWQSAASWLNSKSANTTSLIVPGSPVGTYTWGSPIDEPMQWLSSANWAARGLIPDSSVGNIQVQDAVESVLDGGVPNPGLAAYLSQAGVRYLVVRNDLAKGSGAPSPLQMHQNLSATPDLAVVATFGPSNVYRFRQFAVRLPAIEIYRVGSGLVQGVITAPVDDSLVISGSASALLSMDQLGVDPGDRAVFLSGNGGVPSNSQTWVVTDTAPRVGVTFGQVRYNETYVLLPNQVSPLTGKQPVGWTIVPGNQHLTVARFIGAKDVISSSSGSNVLFASPESQPAAALDRDSATAWVANATDNSAGQWLRVDFNGKLRLSTIGLQLTASAKTPRVVEVTVSTARGSLNERVVPTGKVQNLNVPRGPTSWLKVKFAKVLSPERSSLLKLGAGISELKIPGVSVEKAEVLPTDELTRFSSSHARLPIFLFTSPTPLSIYGPKFGGGDAEPQMVRIFTSPKTSTYNISGTVTARPGADLGKFLKFIGPSGLTAAPFNESCGKGPAISIDGKTLPTEVSGTFGGLKGFRQMKFAVCGSPVTISAGTHVLKGNSGGFLKVVGVALAPHGVPPFASLKAGSRSVAVKSWGTENRSVVVGPGASAYLIARQNWNSGWTAHLGGHSLKAVQVNGWEQAWIVPAGAGGSVTMTYGPDTLYHAGLIVGGLFAILLVALALWPSRRVNHVAAIAPRRAIPAVLVGSVGFIVLFVVAGLMAASLLALLAIVWLVRSSHWLSALAALSYLAAGLFVAHHIGTYTGTQVGAFGRPAQIASCIALAAVFAALVVDGKSWRNRTRDRDERGASDRESFGADNSADEAANISHTKTGDK